MSLQAWVTLGITVVAAILLITEVLRPDLIALLVLVTLGLSGLVGYSESFSGFSHTAVMTILGISIISEALRQTGITNALGRWMAKAGQQSPARLVAITTLTSAGLSLFMNNIAAVGVLLPAVSMVSRRTKIAPSRLLIPLAFGTSLGGMATLLTTMNIIVSGTLKDAGYKPFGLLDFLPIGIPIVLFGTIYLATIGLKLLPKDKGFQVNGQLANRLAELYQLDQNLHQVDVLPECPYIGMNLAQSNWQCNTGLCITAIIRNEKTLPAPRKTEIILAGDRLICQGEITPEILSQYGLKQIPYTPQTNTISDDSTVLAELIIAPHARLLGKTLRELRFREAHSVNVLAIWRNQMPIRAGLVDLPLQFGDALLIQGAADQIHQLRQLSEFVLLEEDPDAVLKPRKGILAAGITLVCLAIAASGSVPTATVVIAAAVLLVLTGCLSMEDAYASISWKSIFLIAGMWSLSTAIRTTGLATELVNILFSGTGIQSILLAALILILLALVLTQLMSGQVASLVLAPFALSAAAALHTNPYALAMAVALGCSLSFPTPFGHPVNMMVMTPGGYTLRDFWRVGGPLTVITILIILMGLKVFWGV